MPRQEQWLESPHHQLSLHIYQIKKDGRPPGCDTGWRSLPATLIETPIGGSWMLYLKDRADPIRVRDHEVMIIPTGTTHRLLYKGPRPMKTGFLFAGFRWMAHWDLFNVYRLPLVLPRTVGLKLDPIISRMDKLLSQLNASITDTSRVHEQAFRALSLIMAHRHNEQPELSPHEYERLSRVLGLINSNPKHEVSCEELAAQSNLSVSRFHTIFKQATGLAPKIYQRNLRLKHAITLLLGTQQPVRLVAEDCGFHSQYYFTRFFTKHIGQSPSQFRRESTSAKRSTARDNPLHRDRK